MNKIVRAWIRHEQRRKQPTLDAVQIDNESVPIPLVETGERKMAPASTPSVVSVNKFALNGLVLYGEQGKVEALYRETRRTVKRLGLTDKLKDAKPFTGQGRGKGGEPPLPDVMRWLDGLQNDKLHKRDVSYMLQVHVTAATRCRPAVLKEKG